MKIDWFTFAAQIVNFAVLVWLLNRFLYAPITRAMQNREDAIAERMQEADDKIREADMEKENYVQLSRGLETQRQELFQSARQEADEAQQKLIAQARADIKSRRDDWLESLEREKISLVNLVRQRASNQVVATTREALSQLADAELEEQTIVMFLKQLKQLNTSDLKFIQQETKAGNRAMVVTAFEVSSIWQGRISSALADLGLHDIAFNTLTALVCGIELHIGGHKIGWSMQEYLMSLSEEISSLVTQEVV